jgi:hypothetical protein
MIIDRGGEGRGYAGQGVAFHNLVHLPHLWERAGGEGEGGSGKKRERYENAREWEREREREMGERDGGRERKSGRGLTMR